MRHALFIGAASIALLPHAASAQSVTTPATASQQDIVVTATPFATGINDTPSITAKVDRNEILEAGGGSIADSLKDVPGIAATGFAAGATRPIIRGLSHQR